MGGNETGMLLNSEECPQFFKIYMPDHCSTQLRIPPAFLKYFKGCVPPKFILVTSSRKSWEVDMNKVNDDVFFKSGWEKFVQDNSLEFGDFLIFYYNGGSNFYVSIFEKNNCVKEIKAANNKSEKQPTHVLENDTSTTDEQKKISVENWNLSFEATIQQRNMTMGYILVPKVFYDGVKEYRPLAKLQHAGRTWDVKVIHYGDRVQFNDGWSLFALENCLIAGDVCCFKMIDLEPEFYLLDVSICREL